MNHLQSQQLEWPNKVSAKVSPIRTARSLVVPVYPCLLDRLSGEAWRATEHLSVASIRSTEGWLEVLKTLDKHYKYLPETELHEAIDEFLFFTASPWR